MKMCQCSEALAVISVAAAALRCDTVLGAGDRVPSQLDGAASVWIFG